MGSQLCVALTTMALEERDPLTRWQALCPAHVPFGTPSDFLSLWCVCSGHLAHVDSHTLAFRAGFFHLA